MQTVVGQWNFDPALTFSKGMKITILYTHNANFVGHLVDMLPVD